MHTHKSLITAAAAAAERVYESNYMYGDATAQRLYGETLANTVADAGVRRGSDIVAAAQAAGDAAYDAVYAAAAAAGRTDNHIWDDAVDASCAAYAAELRSYGWTVDRSYDYRRRQHAGAAARAVLAAFGEAPAGLAEARTAYRYALRRY